MTAVNVPQSPPLYHNVGRWGTLPDQLKPGRNPWRIACLTAVGGLLFELDKTCLMLNIYRSFQL